jgi:uncharacterized membrane protein YoaK (UPF0700 family)
MSEWAKPIGVMGAFAVGAIGVAAFSGVSGLLAYLPPAVLVVFMVCV